VYRLGSGLNVQTPATFFYPLTQCINEHPWLCVVAGDRHTDKPFYERVKTIDLERHVSIHESNKDDTAAIEDLLEATLDAPFPSDIPPWKILVLPLQTGECFVGFSFSHSLGDGISGKCFHSTFLAALQKTAAHVSPSSSSAIVQTPDRPLPEPFDTPARLPISWSFLLGPLIAALIPGFLANLLGLRAAASSIDEGTWTATRMFFKAGEVRTKVKMFEIDAPVVENVVRVSRNKGAKLTGTVQQIIARALASQLRVPQITNFVSQTAVNMRKSVGIPEDEFGEFVSGCYVTHAAAASAGSLSLSEDEWAAAREATDKLALAATQLADQPIGLLRYAPSVRNWTVSKLGRERDGSFELSNLGSFDGGAGAGADEDDVKISRMVFSQPGHVVGPPICFNLATVKGGSLVCTVTWQTGALGIERDEMEFVEGVAMDIQNLFENLNM
jgi:hypothetical protein